MLSKKRLFLPLIVVIALTGRASAQEQTDPRNFIIKFSPVHLFERTFKAGFEYKTNSLRHSLTIYGSGISLRERHADYRILTGYSGELQYRYYAVKDTKSEKPVNITSFAMAFVRAGQYLETYKTNPPVSKLLQETSYTMKDLGVAYGLQLNWKRFTVEAYVGPAIRLNDVDIEGVRTQEGKFYQELDYRRRPPLDHHGFFWKGAFEIGYSL